MIKRIFLLTILAALIFSTNQSAFAQNEFPNISQAELQKVLEQDYGWKVQGNATVEHLNTLLQAGQYIENYIDQVSREDGKGWIKEYLGNAVFHIDGQVANSAYQLNIRGFVFPNNDVYLPIKFTVFVAVHELGHVLDNGIGGDKPAVWFGGGAADRMIADLGGHPEAVPFPHCLDREDYIAKYAGPESWPYYMNGGKNPADDFADTFLVAVVGNDLPVPNVVNLAPQRLAWMDAYIASLN